MYKKAYGIIETLAPIHVGATAGEESGNLNLIFRDQFTQTGIIPGSSIRGRLRSEIRRSLGETEANKWYGQEAELGKPDSTTESVVKFEYASLLWLPVFCPGQPIVWVTCPRLLKRYQRIAGDSVKLKDGKLLNTAKIPANYTGSQTLKALDINGKPKLFFNFGFLTVDKTQDLSAWFPLGEELPAVVVADDEIAMIHDMALYRQSRVALDKEEKKAKKGAFFNTEALPEGTILVFPVGIKDNQETWQPFGAASGADIYLGGLESIGFGHCYLTLKEV
ncbi:type III-B CRISPR module RAMP protein Cmr4 [Microcoleus sp. EPA2]|uniref:type III-B CRISPR module RAMP protein Cmr4 n=1 Tax=Microcoleus sp. EPA2 TaxID=2841654 RepID=UPI00312B36F1